MSKPLRFTPYAFAKLSFLRDYGDTEIGGFGVCETDDPLLVTDVHLPVQDCTSTTVELDGESLLAYRAQCRKGGIDEKHSFRIWIHTHPEMPAQPSGTDESTFSELFDSTEWGIMAILSKTKDTYVRVRYGGDGPTANAELDWEVDYTVEFNGSDIESWIDEYNAAVTIITFVTTRPKDTKFRKISGTPIATGWPENRDDYSNLARDCQSKLANDCQHWVDIVACQDCTHEWEACDTIDPQSGDRCPRCSGENVMIQDTYQMPL